MRARGARLRAIPVRRVRSALEQTAARVLDPADSFRRRAIAEVAADSGFSQPMVELALEWSCSEITDGQMRRLLVSELGTDDATDDPDIRSARLVLLIAAGAIFQPVLNGVVYALLLKSPILVKCSSHEKKMIPLFIEALRETDPDVGNAAGVVATADIIRESDAVIAYGSDATILEIRRRTRGSEIFVGHGHKVSAAVIGRKVLESEEAAENAAKSLAMDIAMYDQLGCLSPQNVWIEKGAVVSPAAFAQILSKNLDTLSKTLPAGRMSTEQAALIRSFRNEFEFRAGHDAAVRYFFGDKLSYTVVIDPDPVFRPSPLGRTILIKPVEGLAQVPAALSGLRGHLQGISAAPMEDFNPYVGLCRDFGASYFCETGRLQRPPLTWQNAGVPCLKSLIA